jgi:GNAT superfamily N-acetyltransferase
MRMAKTPTLWIRRFREEHRGALRAVLPNGMLEAIDGHRRNRDGVSCLLLDDRVVGVAVLTRGGQITVFVHPSVQRRGIGEVAAKHLIKVARRACLARVHGVARHGSSGAALARKVGLREVKRDAKRAHFELRLL